MAGGGTGELGKKQDGEHFVSITSHGTPTDETKRPYFDFTAQSNMMVDQNHIAFPPILSNNEQGSIKDVSKYASRRRVSSRVVLLGTAG